MSDKSFMPLYILLGFAVLYALSLIIVLYHSSLEKQAAQKIDKWTIYQCERYSNFEYHIYHNNNWCLERISPHVAVKMNGNKLQCAVCDLSVPEHFILQRDLLNGKE